MSYFVYAAKKVSETIKARYHSLAAEWRPQNEMSVQTIVFILVYVTHSCDVVYGGLEEVVFDDIIDQDFIQRMRRDTGEECDKGNKGTETAAAKQCLPQLLFTIKNSQFSSTDSKYLHIGSAMIQLSFAALNCKKKTSE